MSHLLLGLPQIPHLSTSWVSLGHRHRPLVERNLGLPHSSNAWEWSLPCASRSSLCARRFLVISCTFKDSVILSLCYIPVFWFRQGCFWLDFRLTIPIAPMSFAPSKMRFCPSPLGVGDLSGTCFRRPNGTSMQRLFFRQFVQFHGSWFDCIPSFNFLSYNPGLGRNR